MAKKSIKVEVNNFVQGLITEGSPLNFPPNATMDESNFVLNRDGTRNRRLGIDFEADFALLPSVASLEQSQVNTAVPFKWTNVAGNAGNNFLVVQSDLNLSIFDLKVNSISGNGLIGLINLQPFGFNPNSPVTYASVDGKLIVASGAYEIVIVSYNGSQFGAESRPLLVRDVWGVEISYDRRYETDPQFRGVVPLDTHRYNLYNQSWGIPRQIAAGPIRDAVEIYTILGVFPSNSETVWPGLQFKPVGVDTPPAELVYPELYRQAFGADVVAAKGHYIIDVLRRGSSRVQNVEEAAVKHAELFMKTFTTVSDITPAGATTVCEFAGRVFYAGFSGTVINGDSRSPRLSNYILFSQLVKSTDDIAKCYQEGDPTSRDSNDLVDTDGGFIRLSGAEGIVGMVNLSSSLIVFAKNGVWSITGGNDYGFNATNYKAERISSFGAIGSNTIVEDGSRALFWSEDGIYAVIKDQFGSFKAENITQKTIQKLYDNIPSKSKSKAIGIFDPIGKKLRWVYHTGTRFTPDSETKELVLDLTLGAFYQFTVGNTLGNTTEVLSPFASVPFVMQTTNSAVKVEGDFVASLIDTVSIQIREEVSSIQTIKYLIGKLYNGSLYTTFGFYRNSSFLDWESSDGTGVDAQAYMVTGAVTAGDSSVAKQIPYLTLHLRRTEEGVTPDFIPLKQSSCLVQTQWDWANSANSNKWSSKFQGYRQRRAYLAVDSTDIYDTGFQIVTTKNKIRGRGRAFALRMETEPAKDCQIIGWSIALNGNAVT